MIANYLKDHTNLNNKLDSGEIFFNVDLKESNEDMMSAFENRYGKTFRQIQDATEQFDIAVRSIENVTTGTIG